VPKEIPFDRACLIGCGVMTGIGAVVRKAKVPAGSSVAVIGCGAVGLNALQGARLAGAATIIAADVGAAKLERAKAFGATHVVEATATDAVDQLRALTAGRGADHVFEAAGHPEAFRLSVEAVRPAGQVVWLGKVNVNQDVSFRWGSLMGEKRIVRSSYGDALPQRDFPWLVEQYLEGRLLLDELITRRIRLDEINDGFADLANGIGTRTVIQFPCSTDVHRAAGSSSGPTECSTSAWAMAAARTIRSATPSGWSRSRGARSSSASSCGST